jgi:hypothetical protein
MYRDQTVLGLGLRVICYFCLFLFVILGWLLARIAELVSLALCPARAGAK